jgi:hypothetical protein
VKFRGMFVRKLFAVLYILVRLIYSSSSFFPLRFPAHCTVAGHKGEVVFGKLSGIPAMCFRGRFHSYEVRMGQSIDRDSNVASIFFSEKFTHLQCFLLVRVIV